MTSLSQRREVIVLVAGATQAGARQEHACWAIGLSERTVQRWQRDQCQADLRPARVQTPKNPAIPNLKMLPSKVSFQHRARVSNGLSYSERVVSADDGQGADRANA